MKILHSILTRGFYGSERYCAELAAEQARDGHDVEILIEDTSSDCARGMRQAVALANHVGAGTLRLVSFPRWLPVVLQRPFARRALARFRPDIVHTHLAPAARRIGRVGQRMGIPHVSTLLIHYHEHDHGPCDGLIALTSLQLKSIPERVHNKVAVIWLWLPTSVRDAIANDPPADAEALRRAWGAGDGDIVIGSVGRLAPEKGMDVLIRAFRVAFPRGDEPVRLVIAGEGEMRPELAALLHGDARIALVGAQDNIAPFYRAFDVFVSASRFEPFGIAIVEAMAAGLPLVLTPTDGPSEFMRPEQALWAGIDDEESLAQQLLHIAARGRERFTYDLEPFAQHAGMRKVVHLYRRILKHDAAG